MSPRVSFNHEVNGISPAPSGNFLDGRRLTTLGAEMIYLGQWAMDLACTRIYGARALNTLRDRDFASRSVRDAF